MLIIGERINATRKAVKEAVFENNAELIREEAKKQDDAGAHYIDVNAGAKPEGEKDYMCWMIEIIQEVTQKPLCLDSASPEVIAEGLKQYKNGRPMVNSISMETGRHEKMLPLIKEHNALVVALAMDDRGIPKTPEDRLEVVEKTVEAAEKHEIPLSSIYVDPLIMALSSDTQSGVMGINLVRRIKERWPEIKTTCGLSNISFGLPLRRLLNRTFLAMLMAAGLDSAIIDPLDKEMIAAIAAAEALLGQDEFCMNYIKMFREGRLE